MIIPKPRLQHRLQRRAVTCSSAALRLSVQFRTTTSSTAEWSLGQNPTRVRFRLARSVRGFFRGPVRLRLFYG